MSTSPSRSVLSRLLSEYGMVGMLLLLCLCCSLGTIQEQKPEGRQAARDVARRIAGLGGRAPAVVIVADDAEFTEALNSRLESTPAVLVETISGKPQEMRAGLERLAVDGTRIDAIATTLDERLLVQSVVEESPSLQGAEVVYADTFVWPTFLMPGNLLEVASRNAVIGVIAIGMTMVIITGGIDLSVGSLVALSAVVAATLIAHMGGKEAGVAAMILGSLGAVAACALVGGFSGLMITRFKVPPFVVTLAILWVARGLAKIISGGKSIDAVPDSYNWLGGKATLSVPNTLLLMLLLFAAGHVLMSRTTLGRHIYAVGGNRLAARLSGIRVNRVLLVVYVVSGAMAGIGGVMLASQFKSGVPNYGEMYELYAIAACVLGGTSLAGGEGTIVGTLIGVLIMAVIQNAMNLLGLGDDVQNVVLGSILLAVVVLDTLRRLGWRRLLTPE